MLLWSFLFAISSCKNSAYATLESRPDESVGKVEERRMGSRELLVHVQDGWHGAIVRNNDIATVPVTHAEGYW